MVIARYITKEIASTFSAIVFILLFIALSNKFVVFLAKAASGQLPVAMVFKVVGLYIPEVFGILAPIALFVAILFTHSRLHADSEVVVLLTSGFDWAKLTKATMVTAVAVSIAVAIINLSFVPEISEQREKLIADGQITGVMHAVTPGKFQMVDDSGDLVFYVEDVDTSGKLHNIFIAQQKSDVIITAKSANIQQISAQEFYLVLHNGYRYVGTPGHANYSVTKFSEYGRELKYDSPPVTNADYMRPTSQILKSDSIEDKAEWQWRLAMPIAVLILALLAVPIAKVQPRQGRYARFLPGVLVYMTYYNALTIVKGCIVKGIIPVYPGLWLVHAIFLSIAIVMLLRVSGRWHEYFR